jgi:hypothetical protein
MEQTADLNLILGIIFGLLSIFLVGFCITISFVVLSMRKSLDETDRRLEKILNKRLREILLELKTLTEPIESQAAPIEEKSKNKRQKHRVTQIY